MKLMIFDLDDTLLNSEGMVSHRNKDAILKCSQKGIKIGYITVRSARMMNKFLDGLPCDCIANYNGATIHVDQNLIVEKNIPYRDAIKLIGNIQEIAPDVGIAAYFEPFCYKNQQVRHYITQEIIDYDFHSAPLHDFQRIRIFPNGYDIDMLPFLNDQMQCQISGESLVISNIHANKGEALETLMRYYGFKKEEVISFGDSMSDVSMLKASGIGIAMGNALPEVKSIADDITLTNNEDGVAVYIERFLR